MAAAHQVCECVTVEHRQEGIERLSQHGFQLTGRGNRAGIRFRIEAFHDIQIHFRAAHNRPEIDEAGFTRKADATRTPDADVYVTLLIQRADNSNKMMTGYSVDPADFACGD